ncbi:DUF262 domain-containing protein [Bifidobacterium tsurumiense]|uniref:GmrSD restriction endonucleases N-terminal domain-containing protein n=1 Tax=Bifidobacterium tsurumiense TaxID=356829 RepID=A0A087EI32_9BIFI|nr:DUF262 domain-containing protein [Bifidobacterium tsurumiense]KFJ07433.1 hypothetical protein BITS_0669 [Bifidobacterium tsurumiense]
MSDNKYQQPITIATAINNIYSRKYLLPGIQRHFTWDTDRIEKLFDSVMQDYPINTLMLWHITDLKIKQNYRFYNFICDYVESRSGGTMNEKCNPAGQDDFDAVIDGQQRLTSLYIGLKGSYTVHKKNKSWHKSINFTKRRLYLNLMKEATPNEDDLAYDFKFRAPSENDESIKEGNFWFPVSRILSMAAPGENDDTHDYAVKHALPKHANKVLFRLYTAICNDLSIQCYQQNDQDQDKVLDIFTRTNSGGVPLSKSDLIMAIVTSSWPEIRERSEALTKNVWNDTGFAISKDFILKSFLVIYNPNDIRFKMNNFGESQVEKLRKNWDELTKVITNTFLFLKNQGFSDDLFRAKNAAIPLMYFFQKTELHRSASKTTFPAEIATDIIHWLTISFLKNIFSGQTDTLLKHLHDVIEQYGTAQHFPFREIIMEFKGTNKNYTVDDDFLDQILDYRYQQPGTEYVLRLLQGATNPGLSYEQDHLHPKSVFHNEKLLEETFTNEEDLRFAKDEANWNSIANLQLLEKLSNIDKSNKSLAEWASEPYASRYFYVGEKTSLELKDFREFIKARRETIKRLIREAVA